MGKRMHGASWMTTIFVLFVSTAVRISTPGEINITVRNILPSSRRPGDEKGLTTKTPAQQRTTSFVNIQSAYTGTQRVAGLLHRLPHNAIVSSVHDLWHVFLLLISLDTKYHNTVLNV